ncbi:DUF1851 domain-containing protein [Pseudoxanthomonas mexicana]|uniref:DUF1851 domain-containing protein n=1 Tax=Pseudoxanthomonas mexicana TaxID=128785 RepID=UPI001FD655BD|nr:DUF1851 domain-containing protein [Pseudoxanthomonas mexicana]UOV04002.1 DUF1851 domain-containing protein [Pseudoxanthomonas mexicana]
MNLSDYLIDQEGYDWAGILADWAWLLPSDLTVWMVNRFGDLTFVPDDGTVQFLDIGAGSVRQLAGSREDFFMQVDVGDNADNWLLIPLTDRCVAAGLALGPGQCYTFKIAPIFDGKHSIDNIEVGDLVVNYSLLAQIHQQINDLPDGAQIKLVLGA